MIASMSLRLTVALARASSRCTADVRDLMRRPRSNPVRGGVVTRIPFSVRVSFASTFPVHTTRSRGGLRLSRISSAGSEASIHLTPSMAAADRPATVPRRFDHNHAA
jgi:hypothetical protein